MKKFNQTLKRPKTIAIFLFSALLFFASTAFAQERLWKTNFTGSGNNTPYFSAIDGDNNIYVLGNFNGTCTSGSTTLTTKGGNDIFISKYNSSGSLLWIQQLGGTGAENGSGITVSSDNKFIYITGSFQNTVSGVTSTGGKDGFIAKYSSSGNLIWFKDVVYGKSSTSQTPLSIKIDKSNKIILSGTFAKEAIIGSSTKNINLTSSRSSSLFISKFDTSGTYYKAVKIEAGISTASSLYTNDIDTSGYYFCGMFTDTLFTQTIKYSKGGFDNFIYKTDTALNFNWVITSGGKGNDYLYSCSAGNNGYIYIGGMFASATLTVDSTITGITSTKTYNNTMSDGTYDIYFAKYSSDGVLQWFNTAGSTGTDYLYRALYKNGDFIAAGQYAGTMTFNNQTISPKAGIDGFAIVQDQNDNLKYLMNFGGTGTDRGETATIDNDGNFVVIGDYTSPQLFIGSTDTLTNSNSGTTDMFVVKYDKASMEFVKTNPKCYGASTGSITATPEGTVVEPFTFAWTKKGNASYSANTATISGLSAGTYYLTFTDNVGYTRTDSVVLTSPDALAITNDNVTNVTCYNGSNGAIAVTVSGGTSPYTYMWATTGNNVNATSEDQTSLTKGTYNLTVTDYNGCISTLTGIEITQPKAIVFKGSVATKINGSQGSVDLTVSGGTPTYAYNWEGPSSYTAATEDISGLTTAGDYTVTVTDAASCTADTTFYIANSHVMNAFLDTKTDVKCKGESTGEIHIATINLAGNAIYSWSPSVSTTADATGLPAGKYYVTVTDDSDNSTSEVTVSISEPDAALSLSIATTQITCHGSSNGILDANPAGGTLPYTYAWTKDGSTYDGGNEILTSVPEGEYVVITTDANGCADTASSTIVNPDAISYTSTVTNVTCNSSKIDGSVVISNLAGGTGTYTFLWSNGYTTQNATYLAAGSYFLTVTDANNCETSSSYTVKSGNTLSASISVTTPNCNGSSNGLVVATISGGKTPYTYVWSNGGNTGTISDIAAGTYTLKVTDASTCTNTFTAEVTEPDALLISSITGTDPTSETATDGQVEVIATGGTSPYTYALCTGTSNITGIFTDLGTGSYYASVTDNNGCGPVVSSSVTLTYTSTLVNDVFSGTKVFPNPATDVLYIELGGVNKNQYQIQLVSVNGSIAYNQILNIDAMQNAQLKLDVSGMAKGFYVLKVNGTVVNQKVIIK
jgi:hypothetical protein